jgi:hypothetical protein
MASLRMVNKSVFCPRVFHLEWILRSGTLEDEDA